MRRALAAALLLTPIVAWLLHAAVVGAIVPIAVNFGVAALFAASLWRGEPLVTRFARLEEGQLTLAQERYCRRLTVVWALYLALLGVAGIVIAAYGSERVVVLWSGVANYLLIALLFVGELWYRRGSARGVLDQMRNVRDAMRKST